MSEERKYEQKPRPMRPMRGRGMPVPKGAIKKARSADLSKRFLNIINAVRFLRCFALPLTR